MENTIVKILGIRKNISNSLEMVKEIEKGFNVIALERVKSLFEVSMKELTSFLDISPKTISRYKKSKKKLSINISDHLYRMVQIFLLASSVLGDDRAAREWLQKPQIGLNNQIPLQLMRTELGSGEVEDLLGRIEYGVIS